MIIVFYSFCIFRLYYLFWIRIKINFLTCNWIGFFKNSDIISTIITTSYWNIDSLFVIIRTITRINIFNKVFVFIIDKNFFPISMPFLRSNSISTVSLGKINYSITISKIFNNSFYKLIPIFSYRITKTRIWNFIYCTIIIYNFFIFAVPYLILTIFCVCTIGKICKDLSTTSYIVPTTSIVSSINNLWSSFVIYSRSICKSRSITLI